MEEKFTLTDFDLKATGNLLVVVDMQNDFVTLNGSLFIDDRTIAPKIAQYIKIYHDSYDYVIFTKDCHTKDDPEFKNYPIHCVKDTIGYKINPHIAIAIQEYLQGKSIYIDKSIFSAADKIDNLIQTNHITCVLGKDYSVNTITVIGVCTNICVLHTVAGLVFSGYKVRVVENLTSSYNTALHVQAIDHMHDVLKVQIV